ncbi:AraC family transcriptional regulator [Gordonia phthalatica]|uniref:AraC family transcriptional regulator n=1 Tax=Gordonia phthalatica TaxID=1136941 RepID=UPI001F39853B|nr:AraC family transcriptional regulator [Gordonia phthalatica]
MDFGLLMATDRGLSNLGPVGLVAREEPDVRSALGIVLRHLNLHNEAIDLAMSEGRGLATVEVQAAAGIELGRQSVELIIASVLHILADVLPPHWAPSVVYLAHHAPEDTSTHRRLLGEHVVFDHEFSGIVLPGSDLDQTNPLSNPQLRPFVQEYLGLLVPGAGPTLPVQVHDLIATLLPTGNFSADKIARSLGMDRRTLHRKLVATGDTYSSILDAVRREHASTAILRGHASFTEIAVHLGFSELSAFSRWFRGEFGASPRAWARKAREQAAQ